jgi:hypothetical protein
MLSKFLIALLLIAVVVVMDIPAIRSGAWDNPEGGDETGQMP